MRVDSTTTKEEEEEKEVEEEKADIKSNNLYLTKGKISEIKIKDKLKKIKYIAKLKNNI